MAQKRFLVVGFGLALGAIALLAVGLARSPALATGLHDATGDPSPGQELYLDLQTDSDNDRDAHQSDGINSNVEEPLEMQDPGRILCQNMDGDADATGMSPEDWAKVNIVVPQEDDGSRPASVTLAFGNRAAGQTILGGVVYTSTGDDAQKLALPKTWHPGTAGDEPPSQVYVGRCLGTGAITLTVSGTPPAGHNSTVVSDSVRFWVTQTKSWTPRGRDIFTYEPYYPGHGMIHDPIVVFNRTATAHGWLTDGGSAQAFTAGQCNKTNLIGGVANAGLVMVHTLGGHGQNYQPWGAHVPEIAVGLSDAEKASFAGDPNVRQHADGWGNVAAFARAQWFQTNWQATLNGNMAIVFIGACFSASDHPDNEWVGTSPAATVQIDSTTHRVSGLTITGAGSGLIGLPTVTIVGNGFGAIAHVTSLNAQGGIAGIAIDRGGSGYTQASAGFSWGGTGSVAALAGGRVRFGYSDEVPGVGGKETADWNLLASNIEAASGCGIGRAYVASYTYWYSQQGHLRMFCRPNACNWVQRTASGVLVDANPGQWTTLNPAASWPDDASPQSAQTCGPFAGCLIFNTYMFDDGHPDQALTVTQGLLREDNPPSRRWFGNSAGRYGLSFDYWYLGAGGITAVADKCRAILAPPPAAGNAGRMPTFYNWGFAPTYGTNASWPDP